jgi:steroid 5-alpha reductase family enzyme
MEDYMALLIIFSIAFGLIIALMFLLWLISLIMKNSSIVDIFWGAGFVITGWVYFILTPDGYLPRKILLCTLVTIWGLRLSIHIFNRNKGKPEDFRYQTWRQEAGRKWVWLSFFKVFLTQGVLLAIISTPLLAAQWKGSPNHFTFLDVVGVVVWGIGFTFEALGDLQLARFISNPENKGKLMVSGVWQYTRHPNYFGDSAQWWGYFLIALAAGGWWTVFSPIIMTYLLVNVSGVALLEKSMQKKPGYDEYKRKTNSFIPWFPKNSNK